MRHRGEKWGKGKVIRDEGKTCLLVMFASDGRSCNPIHLKVTNWKQNDFNLKNT